MGVIRLSRSGKSLLFISDDGVQYFTSVSWLNGLLSGRFSNGMIVLKRLPFGVPVGKFPLSELYDPAGLSDKLSVVDGLSSRSKREYGDVLSFVDKDVWS